MKGKEIDGIMNKIALLALLFLTPAAWSQANEITDSDKFALWNNCGPMSLSVEVSESAAKINLTKQDVETAVRSRLRAARLYDGEAFVALFVQVGVVGNAFGLDYVYAKPVMDLSSGLFDRNGTWLRTSYGTHGQESSYILSAISNTIDHFIDEYLRVNESGCSK